MLGAAFYNGFLALTQVPQELSNWVVEMALSPYMVLSLILLFYLVYSYHVFLSKAEKQYLLSGWQRFNNRMIHTMKS